MRREDPDVLIDQLLREILGGDRPRDLTVRVMAHAKMYDRTRRRWWVGGASAVAASLLVALGIWAMWPQAYPEPNIDEGVASIQGGDKLERGNTVETDEIQTAKIGIGGYVNLAMEPQTAMTIGGSKYAEKVFLERGGMDVAVTKKKGTFDVAVGAALVHVTGTKFHLGVQNKELADRKVKQLVVAVKEGSVVVSGVDKEPVTLAADSPLAERTFEISSEPKVVRPKPVRAGPISLLPIVSTTRKAETIPSTSRPVTTRPAPPAILSRPLQVIIEPGRVEFDGRLGTTVSGVYLVENADRRILLYAQQPVPANLPKVGSYVHVVWENGRTVSVEGITTTTMPASQPR